MPSVLAVDDDDAFETVIGRDGQPVRILKDQRTSRVSMYMRDGLSPLQVAVMADRQRLHDGSGDPLSLHRPGPRINDGIDRTETARAYEQMCRDSAEAWRRGPGGQQDAGSANYGYTPAPGLRVGEFIAGREGDECMTDDRSPGRLVSENGRLVCRATRRDSAPAWRPDLSLPDSEAIKAQARAEAARDQAEAWRKLGSST
jgi:hypothetical protein